jgi:hypothetical protein
MIGVEIVKDFMIALESQEYTRASDFLSDDFTYTCMLPKPLNKRQYIALVKELKEGMPDMSFNLHDIHEVERLLEELEVEADIRITGTHTDIMELVPLSLPPIPETGRRVMLPEEHLTFIIENEKIKSITVHPVLGGGFQGLLEQLGIDAPIIQ